LNLTSNNFTSRAPLLSNYTLLLQLARQRGAMIVRWAFIGPNEQKFVVSE